MNGDSGAKAVAGCAVLVVYLGLWVLIAWMFQFAWNYAMPDLFGLPVMSLGQAACVVFLLGFLRRTIVRSGGGKA